MQAERDGRTRKRLRHRVMLAVACLVIAAAGMVITMVHPFSPHTHTAVAHSGKNSTAAMRPIIPPIPPITPRYGAIAVADNGAVGKAWRHRTRSGAETSALNMCGDPSCRVLSVFTKCGAIAHDGTHYHGGLGHARNVAEHDAKTRLGGGWIVTWACH